LGGGREGGRRRREGDVLRLLGVTRRLSLSLSLSLCPASLISILLSITPKTPPKKI